MNSNSEGLEHWIVAKQVQLPFSAVAHHLSVALLRNQGIGLKYFKSKKSSLNRPILLEGVSATIPVTFSRAGRVDPA